MSGAMRKRIMVTGGAGFLGSHLCAALARQGHYVLCVDNYSTAGLQHRSLAEMPNIEFLRQDVIDPLHADVDEIYNLACPASPVHYRADPLQTTKSSVLGALNVLELARRTGARVLQASTSEIYGDPQVHPQPEEYKGYVNPIGPRACYNEGKRCAETLFMDYRRQYLLPVKIVRIFNTYGPGMRSDDGRVVPTFIHQALAGLPLTLHGDGRQTRSFCYVDDLVDGLQRMMRSDDDLSGPLNLGNPEEVSMLELAVMVVALIGARSQIRFVPAPTDDPARRCPDIALARHRLEWSPKISLAEDCDAPSRPRARRRCGSTSDASVSLRRGEAAVR